MSDNLLTVSPDTSLMKAAKILIDFSKFPELADFRERLASEDDLRNRQDPARHEDELTRVDKLFATLWHPVPDRAGPAIDILACRLRSRRTSLFAGVSL